MSNEQSNSSKQSSANEEKAAEKKSSETQNMKDSSGLTQQLGKPVNDRKEDSLASKMESIQSQYQQLKSYKHLATSGISGAFGDLLGPSPSKKEEKSSLEEVIKSGSHQEAGKEKSDDSKSEDQK